MISYPRELRQALSPITSVSAPSHQGMASLVTFAETALGPVAVKRAAGPRLAALHRERQILDALRALDLPVPECLLFVDVEKEQATEGWLVMRRLPGEPLQQVLQTAGPAGNRTSLLTKLGKFVAKLHAQAIPPGLAVEPIPWLEFMLDLGETGLPLGLWEGSRARLEELKAHRPLPVAPRLIHGDMFLDNVLTDGIEITGLIDWAFGGVGDPRYDLVLAMDDLSASDQQAFLQGYGMATALGSFEIEYFHKLAVFC